MGVERPSPPGILRRRKRMEKKGEETILTEAYWLIFFFLLSSLFFFAFQLCGVLMARRLLPGESGGARLLLGSVLGSVLLQWCPVPFSFFLGFTAASNLCGLGSAVLLCVLCLAAFKKGERVPLGFSAFRRRKFLWAAAAVLLLFWALVWRSFRLENGRIFSSQATYGDMSMHLSFITSIARQGAFPPGYPLLPGFRLSYPFLSDSISSSLYLLYYLAEGLTGCWDIALKWSYFLPMAVAGAQALFGGYLFVSRLLGSAKKAALAWVFFFLNGGFGFLYFFGSREDFFRIFTDFYQTPTNYVEGNIRWVNVLVDMMLPQRATLFGWAVLFPTLYLLYRAVFEREKRYFLTVGILAGLLPMIHTHSFVALALCCGVWLLASLLRLADWERQAARVGKCLLVFTLLVFCVLQHYAKGSGQIGSAGLLWAVCILAGVFLLFLGWLLWKAVRAGEGKALLTTWGVLLLAACVLALPQLCFWTFRQAGSGGFIRGHFGWVIGEDEYLWFYLKNLGLAGVLALGGVLTARSGRFMKYAPALFLWLLAELVVFQPNNYDNNKLLYVAYLFLCCAGAECFFRLLDFIRLKGAKCVLVGLTVAVCSCSAVLTIGREWNARYEIYGAGAIALSRFVEENTAPDSLILTDTRHNNEICTLAGRNIVCGSSSYLYFHGLPFGKWEHAAGLMYEHPAENPELFREYGVDYVLVSDFERSTYEVDEGWIAAHFQKIYDDGVRVLYDARPEKTDGEKERS